MKTLLISRFETPSYNSLIEIKLCHINYSQLCVIDDVLQKALKDWDWLQSNVGISRDTFEGYLSGQHHLSLRAVENISLLLRAYVQSPKIFMNPNAPYIHGGKLFKLNIGAIIKRYNITQTDLILGLNIERYHISKIARNKTTHLRVDTLIKFYEYFKGRGVPLKSPLDLIYFPEWDESPLHFAEPTIIRGNVYKFASALRMNSFDKANEQIENYNK
jgi:hypothetical protein